MAIGFCLAFLFFLLDDGKIFEILSISSAFYIPKKDNKPIK